jgi:hypothetical protein
LFGRRRVSQTDEDGTTWLEPVADEQYAAANPAASA